MREFLYILWWMGGFFEFRFVGPNRTQKILGFIWAYKRVGGFHKHSFRALLIHLSAEGLFHFRTNVRVAFYMCDFRGLQLKNHQVEGFLDLHWSPLPLGQHISF